MMGALLLSRRSASAQGPRGLISTSNGSGYLPTSILVPCNIRATNESRTK